MSHASHSTATALPAYLLSDNAFTASNGVLTVAGVSLTDIAEEYGTPCFVYDQAHIEARCREAVKGFPAGVSYASKAFCCANMLSIAAGAGMRIDVCSAGELYTALVAHIDPAQIVFHGNNKSSFEIELALRVGVGAIVVDSFDELKRLDHIAGSLDRDPAASRHFAERNDVDRRFLSQPMEFVRVLVRVNAGIEAHTHEYLQTGQADSKFGISLQTGEAQRAVNQIVESDKLVFGGVHSHIGSLLFALAPYAKLLETLSAFLRTNHAEEFCIGGGLGVPYVAGESAPTIPDWAGMVRNAAIDLDLPEYTRLTAEPGRSIVAAAAVTLYRVGVIKYLENIRMYLSVDGGMADNPRPVLYGSGYEAFLPRSPFAERDRKFTIVGKHCESGDVLIQDARLPDDVHVGDILATPVTGAYGYSMASNYNCVTRPPVLFVKDGKVSVAVRRETLRDLLLCENIPAM